MTAYAAGKEAFGFCDRCGFRYDLAELQPQIESEKPNGFLFCEACNDVDHPQLQLGKYRIVDPQALEDPRPDTGQEDSRGLFGWRPVGDNVTLKAVGAVGTVTVTTS